MTNLAVISAFTTVEKKTPNVSNLVKKADYNTKISEIENKITDHLDRDKYISTQELNKFKIRKFYCKTSKFSKKR